MNRTESDSSVVAPLAAAHSTISQRHESMRAQLLKCLPEDAASTPQSNSWPSAAWCYVVGGLGLGAAIAAAAIAMWLFAPVSPAIAVERLVKALDQVGTYTYRMETVSVSTSETGRTVRQVTVGRWRSDPVGLYATMSIVERFGTNKTKPSEPNILVELEEAHQAGSRGMIIDHLKKEFWWIDEELDAKSIGNPLVAIYMVRQRRGRVLRSLGTKAINGRNATGFEIKLGDMPASELGPLIAQDRYSKESEHSTNKKWEWQGVTVEVWIDPTTNLPIEFHFVRRGKDFAATHRFSELKWNAELPANAFELTPPDDYIELAASPFAE